MESDKVLLTTQQLENGQQPSADAKEDLGQEPKVFFQPGPMVTVVAAPPEPPRDTLILAIVTMLCFCWPCGLVALIHSLEARKQFTWGEQELAEAANKRSKKWSIIGIVSGVIIGVIVTVVVMLANVIVRVVLAAV